jgi:hypothetical protein
LVHGIITITKERQCCFEGRRGWNRRTTTPKQGIAVVVVSGWKIRVVAVIVDIIGNGIVEIFVIVIVGVGVDVSKRWRWFVSQPSKRGIGYCGVISKVIVVGTASSSSSFKVVVIVTIIIEPTRITSRSSAKISGTTASAKTIIIVIVAGCTPRRVATPE